MNELRRLPHSIAQLRATQAQLAEAIEELRAAHTLLEATFDARVRDIRLREPLIFGDPARVIVAETAVVNDTLFNTVSGFIRVEADAFTGHSVFLLTGTHDVAERGIDRQLAIPTSGRDITIETGAWIASRAMVIGPCRVGAHAVVAAGAIVIDDVPPGAIVAGNPGRIVGWAGVPDTGGQDAVGHPPK
jgi:hypothetical protein